MTDAEIKAVADELEARAAALVAGRWKKVRDYVAHNTIGVVLGGVAVFAVLKFVL